MTAAMNTYNLIETEEGWSFKKDGVPLSLKEFQSMDHALNYCVNFFTGYPGAVKIIKGDGQVLKECHFVITTGPEFQ
jgi:hypothetical protein